MIKGFVIIACIIIVIVLFGGDEKEMGRYRDVP